MSRYTETMIPRVILSPSDKVDNSNKMVLADSQKQQELLSEILKKDIDLNVFKDFLYSFDIHQFRQYQLGNCWIVAVIKGVLNCESGPALINYMVDLNRSRFQMISQDENFGYDVESLTEGALLTESQALKIIVEGIAHVFHDVISSDKIDNPSDWDFISQKLPIPTSREELSIKDTLHQGWFAQEFFYRLLKNIATEIIYLNRNRDSFDMFEALTKIQENPHNHVSYLCFKQNRTVSLNYNLNSQPLPDVEVQNQHAYTIISVTDDIVTLADPNHPGKFIFLTRQNIADHACNIVVSVLPKHLKTHKRNLLQKHTPLHLDNINRFHHQLPDGCHIRPVPVFCSYRPATVVEILQEQFYLFKDQHGIQLYSLTFNQLELRSKQTSTEFYNHNLEPLTIHAFGGSQPVEAKFGFHEGYITIEEVSDVFDLQLPQVEHLTRDQSKFIDIQQGLEPISFQSFSGSSCAEMTIVPTKQFVYLHTNSQQFNIGTRADFQFFYDVTSSLVDINPQVSRIRLLSGIYVTCLNNQLSIYSLDSSTLIYTHTHTTRD